MIYVDMGGCGSSARCKGTPTNCLRGGENQTTRWPLQVMTFQQNHKVYRSVNLRSVWQANLFATSVYDSRIQGHWSSAKTVAPPKKLSAIPWPFLQLVFPMVSENLSVPKEIDHHFPHCRLPVFGSPHFQTNLWRFNPQNHPAAVAPAAKTTVRRWRPQRHRETGLRLFTV